MKELTKKILESGLVEKHIAQMMERWGSLEPGAADIVGQHRVSKEGLEAFAEDIARLVESDPVVRETVLDVDVSEPVPFTGGVTKDNKLQGIYYGAWDQTGCIIVGPQLQFIRGDRIAQLYTPKKFIVLDIVPIYVDEKMVGQRLTVEELL